MDRNETQGASLLVIRALKGREPTYRAPGFEIHRDDDAVAPAASR